MNKQLISGTIVAVACSYLLWLSLRPVEIVAVHDGKTILVRHFPYLKNRQIAWWESNKDKIQEKFGIPYKDARGYYTIYIQDFGSGYRLDRGTDDDSDLLCFDDMSVAARCIEKKPLMSVGSAPNAALYYE
ncbi:hypothetical protein LG71_05420 [Pluralibacter gergoviae]|uniref:DUF943 family protein n=1 Tax=Pluralibacter gergoviae TaxID=61647 RepID=UPI0004F8C111|nr:DUF943 family protein [Pluralibacter gergoviae]AIQ99377.1 hypothetical protein LG71_05420 [Pluralibacter gergoviae]